GEYARRLAGDVRFELEEIPLPRRGRGDVARHIADEAAALRRRLDKYPGSLRVALEVEGRSMTTEMLTAKLSALRDEGRDLALLVGGPDGLCPALSRECDERWSLSAL